MKAAALAVLWMLFFSPAERVPVTPERLGERLGAPSRPQLPNAWESTHDR